LNHKAKDKDISINQKLRNENQKLKRQLERLRKQISRIDVDKYINIKETLEAQDREDIQFENVGLEQKRIEAVKRDWTCHKCDEDYLRLMIVQRPDGVFYFRLCPTCKKRTRLKPFKDDVKGQETKNINTKK